MCRPGKEKGKSYEMVESLFLMSPSHIASQKLIRVTHKVMIFLFITVK